MGKEYAVLKKKVKKLKSQLEPILSASPDPEPGPAHQAVSDGINQELLFINKLISAEMTSSPALLDRTHRRHLRDIAHEVSILQKAFRAWHRPVVPDEDDHEEEGGGEEGSPGVGFKVYENPEFVGCDDNDDHVREEEYTKFKIDDYVGGEEEEEIIRVDEVGARRDKPAEEEDDEEEEDGDYGATDDCCYRILFGVTIIMMGIPFMLAGFSSFADHHPSIVFLTPT